MSDWFKFRIIFRHDDVINHAINNIFYRQDHIAMIDLHVKFNYDISNRFRVIMKNVLNSLIKEYKRPPLSSRSDNNVTIIIYFFVDNLNMIFPFLKSN